MENVNNTNYIYATHFAYCTTCLAAAGWIRPSDNWLDMSPTAVTVVKIDANVAWKVFPSPAGHIIGVCDELNLCLEADSEEELRSLIPEALHLLMKDLLGDKELDQFLREKGWHAMNLPPRPTGEEQFDVPWHIIAAEGMRRDSQRRFS